MDGFGIHIEGLSKRYGKGDTAVDALKDVNMSVAPGEVVGLIGPSGSGKSTLLKCLGAVIEPTAGRMTLGHEVIFDGGWKIRDLRKVMRKAQAQAHARGHAPRGRRWRSRTPSTRGLPHRSPPRPPG